ncbi:hypothetical protein [Methyloprofundus sedimenti]|uniref:hypothetical protein n=1 Tax=Methyloprofundus sedimenti TaxID=1420851 RepID=UPI001E32CD72|nr:hypothetical protein [Methyloprofundus sedimenti]
MQLTTEYAHLINQAPEKTVLKWFNNAIDKMAKGFYDIPDAQNAYTTCTILILTD